MQVEPIAAGVRIPEGVRLDAGGEGSIASLVIDTPACSARIYLQGAHLTHWQPTGAEPVLFLTEKAQFAPGKAIRGGVPVCWPWFGSPPTGIDPDAPMHGIARTSAFQLTSIDRVGDDIRMELEMHATPVARKLSGSEDLKLTVAMTIGRTLTMRMTTTNTHPAGEAVVEGALHTYFNVGDVRLVDVSGLENVDYLDKVHGFAHTPGIATALKLTDRTDRIYQQTSGTVRIRDPKIGRSIVIEKSGSLSTVVWNPWEELARTGVGLAEGEWTRMLCVETAAIGAFAMRLAAGCKHAIEARIRLERE